MSNVIATAETAELLGVSVRTVHRMVAQGMLPPAGKLPGRTGSYLFDEGDVLALRSHLRRAA